VTQRQAAVHNVLDNQDVLTLNRQFNILGDHDFTGAFGPGAVACRPDEIRPAGNGKGADQIRHKNKGSLENSDHQNFPACVIPGNFTGHLENAAGYFRRRQKHCF